MAARWKSAQISPTHLPDSTFRVNSVGEIRCDKYGTFFFPCEVEQNYRARAWSAYYMDEARQARERGDYAVAITKVAHARHARCHTLGGSWLPA